MRSQLGENECGVQSEFAGTVRNWWSETVYSVRGTHVWDEAASLKHFMFLVDCVEARQLKFNV